MKTLYLHVGAHKTGSTSMQVNMEKHASILEENGITYLTGWNERYEYPHTAFCSTGNANPLAYAMRWINDKKQYENFEPQAVFSHLFEYVSNKETVIVSHEDLISASPPFLKMFRDTASGAGWQIKVVLYVRDQISWHVSNYNQHIRQIQYTGNFESLIAKSLQAANWNAHAKRIEDVFGKENMIVHLFHKRLVQNGIVAFFIEGLGLDWKPFQGLPESVQNVGLSNADALVLLHFNRGGADPQTSNKLMSLLRNLPRGGDCELMTNEFAGLIRAYYAEGNSQLAERYFSDSEKNVLVQEMNLTAKSNETLSYALDRSVSVIRELLTKI